MRIAIASLALVCGLTGISPLFADQLTIPASTPGGARAIPVLYRLDQPVTGRGTLTIKWTDTFGRIADERVIPFTLAHASTIKFRLDPRRASSRENDLRAHLSFDGVDERGDRDHWESDAHASFTVGKTGSPWRDYQVIMWQSRTAEQFAALRRLGITAGSVPGDRGGDGSRVFRAFIEPLLANDLSCYVENIATDFYAAYHHWSPDRPVNWKFVEAWQRHRDHPGDVSAFVREPSLADRRALGAIGDRLRRSVHAYSRYQPLYYNLGDETGIADLSIFWDFDVSSASLEGMRAWLRGQYGSLAALEREWGRSFPSWDAMTPTLTSEAMKQPGENYAAWADFKAWMDVSFARALRAGTDAIHRADARAISAIEGGQVPGWGGYDYTLLTPAVDLIELYDGGDNLEIVRSLDPRKILLTTSAGGGAQEPHGVWRELLRGTRGVVLWDPKSEYVEKDGSLGARGRIMAPTFAELRGALGALLVNSERNWGPVAVLYSPASIRTQWMLDWRSKGDAWSARDIEASYEDDSSVRSSLSGFSRLFEHLGIEHRVISPALLGDGVLRSGAYRLLVLPRAIALSRAEAVEIRRFVADGGFVLADGQPGRFDEHSRKLARPLLADLFPAPGETAKAFALGKGRATYFSLAAGAADGRSEAAGSSDLARLGEILEQAGVEPPVSLTAADGSRVGDVEINSFRNGKVRLLGLQRDLGVSRAGPSLAGASAPEPVSLKLRRPAYLYDLRAKRALGRHGSLDLQLDANAPTVLAVADVPLPAPSLSAPRAARLGDIVQLRLGLMGAAPAATTVLHVDVVDPQGKIVGHYSGNAIMRGGRGVWMLPLAFNDPAGPWRLRVIEALTGQAAESTLEVSSR